MVSDWRSACNITQLQGGVAVPRQMEDPRMKLKALRMALVAGFLMTTLAVIGVTTLEHRLIERASVAAGTAVGSAGPSD